MERLIDESASFTLFLRTDATDQQRKDAEARMRAVPGVTEVTYESSAQAYERFAQLWSASPSVMRNVQPDTLPQSFEAKMMDAAALRKVRDSTVADELKHLPGVQDVAFRCTTIDECRTVYSPQPTASPS